MFDFQRKNYFSLQYFWFDFGGWYGKLDIDKQTLNF